MSVNISERQNMHGLHRSATNTPHRVVGYVQFVAALVSVAVLAAACGGSSDDTGGQADPIRLLEPTEFAEFTDANPAIDLINVHIPYQGHIEGTDAFVNFEQILDFAGLPEDLNDPIVLYCRSGNMSGQAAEALAGAGYTNIVDLAGGMNAWTDSGRELLTDEPTDS